jgi:hypothetical protein
MLGERQYQVEIDGKAITIETGGFAGQAGGAVTVRQGDSVLLATATMSRNPREGIDFFPLTVDYEERMYAGGKIPGSFFRREGRPSEAAILTARLTDRPIRRDADRCPGDCGSLGGPHDFRHTVWWARGRLEGGDRRRQVRLQPDLSAD